MWQKLMFSRRFGCCLIICVVGCGSERNGKSPTLVVPSSLRFVASPFEIDAKIAVVDSDNRIRENAQITIRLIATPFSSERVVGPIGFDGESWPIVIEGVCETSRLEVWIYDNVIGLAQFRIDPRSLMNEQRPLKFAVEKGTSHDEVVSVQVLGADGTPVPAARVSIDMMQSIGNTSLIAPLPEPVWEMSRAITDDEGMATIRLAKGGRAKEFRVDAGRQGQCWARLTKNDRHVIRLDPVGSVRVRLDPSVSKLDAFQFLLTQYEPGESGNVSHWKSPTPNSSSHEIPMVLGQLGFSATYQQGGFVPISSTRNPIAIRNDRLVTIDVQAVPSCRVSGRLVAESEEGQEPVAGASLQLFMESALQVTRYAVTDEAGRFVFSVPPGKFKIFDRVFALHAMLNAYGEILGEVGQRQNELEVGTLTMPAVFEIHGQLLGPDGPFVFADVSGVSDGKRVAKGRTDGDGHFRLLTQSKAIEAFVLVHPKTLLTVETKIESRRPLVLKTR